MKLAASRKRVVMTAGPEETKLPALPELALKRILVPVDFSESSRKALHYATSFARQFNAELLLFHVVEPYPPPPPDYIIADNLVDNAKIQEEAAKELAQWRGEIGESISVRSSVEIGSPYREIVRCADENNIDLIIIGTHGHTRLAHFLLGSTAERVVRHAPCPVLVIREREHDFLVEQPKTAGSSKSKTAKRKG